ncbi:hypothetical protein L6452_32329 [Arctium lappa]|uniref:Uncharacterized protein n=1 Tax=Arctium lappa TaxID=4217 RepID=A0ACB8Z3E2_ARCLA|nr:hypothetical protein L6452_32329 [Arctium lappa]
MDGNKDEALTCLKIGKDALRLNDRARALKFISKAQRLDPSLPVDDLLSTLLGNPVNDSSKSSETGDDSGVRRRVPATGSSTRSGSGTYTEEQITIVAEIKRKKDFYEILDLEKTCSVEDVRKAYRKLSLKVHPDKNNAPGSDEAFKKVSMAFQCLSVDEDRKKYDGIRSDEHVYQNQTTDHNVHQEFGNGVYNYDGDVDAETIFRNFFYGETNHRPTTSRCTGHCSETRTARNSPGGLDPNVLVPVLLVVLAVLVCLLAFDAMFKQSIDEVWFFD